VARSVGQHAFQRSTALLLLLDFPTVNSRFIKKGAKHVGNLENYKEKLSAFVLVSLFVDWRLCYVDGDGERGLG
ncbi:MAG: hypothetical protein ACREAB_12560, partial [Blastocatellia bacterium]